MLRGIATVSLYAADLAAAQRWYTELLGMEPYFNRPGYIEFRIGDYQHELGIIDSKYAPDGATVSPAGATVSPAGAIVYWHVDDLPATLEKVLALGARAHGAITERGAGFITASVVDPFGNILGIMTNPHYLDVLAAANNA